MSVYTNSISVKLIVNSFIQIVSTSENAQGIPKGGQTHEQVLMQGKLYAYK